MVTFNVFAGKSMLPSKTWTCLRCLGNNLNYSPKWWLVMVIYHSRTSKITKKNKSKKRATNLHLPPKTNNWKPVRLPQTKGRSPGKANTS